jgi:hypothetical protein
LTAAPSAAPALARPAPTVAETSPEDRRLAPTEVERLRNAAFGDAERAEHAGRFQEALDSLDEAERSGAAGADVGPIRARLKAELADSTAFDEACARAEQASSLGDHDRALAALRSVRELAPKIGRGAELEERMSSTNTSRDRAERLTLGVRAIERADQLLGGRDLVAARIEVEKARTLIPGSSELVNVETRLRALEHLPPGMAYVELSESRGLFVHRKPVTNVELKQWIDATGRKGAAPWKDKFPEDRADSPALQVFRDEATEFASWRGERLPTDLEWPAIRKTLHLVPGDGQAQAGIFARGFYTVKEP